MKKFILAALPGLWKRFRVRVSFAGAAFALCVVAASPASAQGQANSNTSQAVLHIQVWVVPMVMTPSQPATRQHAEAVVYNFPTGPAKTSVTVEVHLLPVDSSGNGGVLRTTTVVPE